MQRPASFLARLLALSALVAALGAGCGQTGALYLPDEQPQETTPAAGDDDDDESSPDTP